VGVTLAADARVAPMDVERFLASGDGGPWSLAVLDPPYAERAVGAPLLALRPRLTAGATIVLKHHWRLELPDVPGIAATRVIGPSPP
jgi:16S rRNA G966 N2-methylase RsmD